MLRKNQALQKWKEHLLQIFNHDLENFNEQIDNLGDSASITHIQAWSPMEVSYFKAVCWHQLVFIHWMFSAPQIHKVTSCNVKIFWTPTQSSWSTWIYLPFSLVAIHINRTKWVWIQVLHLSWVVDLVNVSCSILQCNSSTNMVIFYRSIEQLTTEIFLPN